MSDHTVYLREDAYLSLRRVIAQLMRHRSESFDPSKAFISVNTSAVDRIPSAAHLEVTRL